MDLHQVRCFLAVVETGSFTSAARKCFIAQPSLSQHILNLEEELGQKLFNRLGRKNTLTVSGERFLIHAQRLLLEADEALRSVGRIRRDPRAAW